MNRAVVIFAQARQFACVIQMRMAQDDGIHLPQVEREIFIERLRFLTMTLKKSAFEQKLFAVDFDEIHRTGGGARRAEKVDFHWRKENAMDAQSRAQLPFDLITNPTGRLQIQSGKLCSC
jgi:hypothetical protein